MAMTKLNIVIQEALKDAIGIPDMRYRLFITVGETTMTSMAVTGYRNSEDYLNSIFNAVIVDAVFSAMDYSGVMMYGHEDMYAVLEASPYKGGTAVRTYYRAILLNPEDQRADGNTDTMDSISDVAAQSFATASFQLIDTAAYDIRMRTVGGIFHRNRTIDVLKYFLASNMLQNKYSQEVAVTSVSVDPYAHTRVYDNLVVPDGTKLVALGDYLHDTYGIYQTGFGIFMKNCNWYVYSPYDVKKFTYSKDKLVVINAPPNKYRGIERNFTINGGTVTVIATGETASTKLSDKSALNHGVGARYGDAEQLMDVTSDPNDPKPMTDPREYMTEFRTGEYQNDLQNIQMVEGRFTSNPLAITSNVAASGGTIITTVWEQGTLDVLYPGMAVEYLYSVDDTVLKMRGTLLKAELVSTVPTGGIVESRHRHTVSLCIFLKHVL